MDTDEKRVKHLEIIQGVVNRLAGNSFAIKGWSITLVSALITIAVDKSDGRYALTGLLPAFVFWILDGYFLWKEKLFRELYNAVRLEKRSKPNELFIMDTKPFEKEVDSWPVVTFCPGKNTLLLFHGVIVLSVLIAFSVLK